MPWCTCRVCCYIGCMYKFTSIWEKIGVLKPPSYLNATCWNAVVTLLAVFLYLWISAYTIFVVLYNYLTKILVMVITSSGAALHILILNSNYPTIIFCHYDYKFHIIKYCIIFFFSYLLLRKALEHFWFGSSDFEQKCYHGNLYWLPQNPLQQYTCFIAQVFLWQHFISDHKPCPEHATRPLTCT